MQVRINCENPQENFAPNAGLITRYVSPGGPGVRLDSNISAGYEFPANYDSAGSLLIAYAHDWEKTLGIMDRALSEYIIGGIKTTTFFALMQDVRSVFTKQRPGAFRRTISAESMGKAPVIALLSMLVVCVGTFLLCILWQWGYGRVKEVLGSRAAAVR